ncbi:glycoside hydrolase family 3 protein [Lentinula edodes]|uniref:glycoside hydrolase family 3 protein n=1 Tax=Lentinula edodes TaxID=5353 RepID=UPI001E8CBE54|nr:glycoside hydrolase family 3 protein [Lentinula edodes]KAH7877108.1 glycoside hydrolase family 3 protein [Lentinula edodes]
MTTFNVEETLSKLSVIQKIKLLSGLGWWHTEPVAEYGIPSMRMSDGPNGVRGTRFFNGVPSSCFPSSTGLGASFDVDLAYKVGIALGEECRAKGCHILLGPTVNTQRSPLGGRSFESFAEDPTLNGLIAAAYINGVQSKGVSATIKHYVANDQEFERFSISSDVSERALREIYLKPFQLALKHSDPWALMSSYNRVNGVHVSESPRLLDDILRKEWGFKGLIMSDWIGVYSTVESIKAGVDLEMPGPTVMRGKAVERSLAAQKLFISDVDERARKVLELLQKAYASGIPFDAPEEGVDTPELRQLLRESAADSIVLLKNDKNVLPLTVDSKIKSIAVIGPNAKYAFSSGGGSARLLESYTVTPLQAIQAVAEKRGLDVKFALGTTTHKLNPLLDPYITLLDGTGTGALLEFWNEIPANGFATANSKLTDNLKPCTWSCTTKVSNCVLLDGVDDTKVEKDCYLRYSTVFTPEESGTYEFSLTLAGSGNLFFGDNLIIDLSTSPAPGDYFMGLGTAEVKAQVNDLKAGQGYKVEIRASNRDYVKQVPIIPNWGGLRIGAVKVVEPEDALNEAVDLARVSDVAILVVGLNHEWESEGYDRPDLELPGLTNRLVSEVLEVNPNTIVVNQSGSSVTFPWIDEAHTVLQAFYGGNELGNGIADVLFGIVNPSAKLSLTFPKRLADVPSYPSYGSKGQEHGRILYNEGVFVGYRGYQIKNITPMFPFGFGLSYSAFEYSALNCSEISSEGKFTVAFTIKNTSSVYGREVAQIYIADDEASLPRPQKELKGFKKVALQAGESQSVETELDREALGFFNDRRGEWVAEKGVFSVLVGASSEDIKLKGSVELRNGLAWRGL